MRTTDRTWWFSARATVDMVAQIKHFKQP